MFGSDLREGVSGLHFDGYYRRRWRNVDGESLSYANHARVGDPIRGHQLAHRDAVFGGDLREGVSRLDDNLNQVKRLPLRRYLQCRKPDLAWPIAESLRCGRQWTVWFGVRSGDLDGEFVPVDGVLFIEVLGAARQDLPLLW